MSEELMYNQLYERTKDFGRTQFVKELMNLERQNKDLQQRIDKSLSLLKAFGGGEIIIIDIIDILEGKEVK